MRSSFLCCSTLLATFSKSARRGVHVDVRRKFSQLVSDHVLGYCDIIVLLAVVHLELQANKVRQDGRRARLRLDWGLSLASLCARNGETFERLAGVCQKVRSVAYGRMLGPVGIVSQVFFSLTAFQPTFPDRSRAKRPCGKHCDVLP